MSHLYMMDFENVFRTSPDALVIDCYKGVTMTEDEAEEFIKNLTKEGSQELTFVASCDCGYMSGNFFSGFTCPECKTMVQTGFATELRYKVWLEIPDIFPPVPHPTLYRFMQRWLGTKPSLNNRWTIDNLLNKEMVIPGVDNPIGQGFKYFYENFDTIINFLAQIKSKTAAGRESTNEILTFINMYRNKLFIRHFPALNQSLHVVSSSRNKKHTDTSVGHIIQAFSDLSSAVHGYLHLGADEDTMNSYLFKIYGSLTTYSECILRNKVEQKEGIIRANILGARLHCTARAVCVPIVNDHEGDELHIPWKMGVAVLKLEILNLLMNRPDEKGRTYLLSEALEIYHRSMVKYDERVDKIMKTLIVECPYKGLPVLMGRNP